MQLLCQGTELGNTCAQQSQFIMITGCQAEHIEETPLCTRHLNYYINCYRHTTGTTAHLLCDTCKQQIQEYDYCTITRATNKWIEEYTTKRITHLMAEHFNQTDQSTQYLTAK